MMNNNDGLLAYIVEQEKVKEARRIVNHSRSLGKQAIYDSFCQAEHGMFYIMYGETPEEVLTHEEH